MAPSKKEPVVEKDTASLEVIEEKLVNLLTNEPDTVVVEGITLKLKRPSFTDKYKSQAWGNKKLKEMEIDANDAENQQISFYISYFGVVNSHVIELKLPDGTAYEFDPAADVKYKFLFEKYVMEELFEKSINESNFVFEVINKFIDWQNGTELTKDELGKS